VIQPPEVRWLWNGDLGRDILRRQLSALRQRGLRSIAIWPWAGLEPPLGSDGFGAALAAACEAAEQLGLSLWLADDLNWPSGTAGGLLLREHPQYAQRALVCTSRWVTRHEPHHLSWRGEGERLVVALALDTGGGRHALDRQLEERGHPVSEPREARFAGHAVDWETELWETELTVPSGDWFLAIATVVRTQPLLPAAIGTRWSSHAPGTLDALNPQAVHAFLEMTVERHVAAVQRWLGTTLQGILTQPPAPLAAHAVTAPRGWRADVFPWFDELPERYEAKHGAPLARALPFMLAALHEQQDKESKGTEPVHDAEAEDPLTALAAERYREAYWPTVAEWCRSRQLQLLSTPPHSLPAVLYSLKGDRKRSVPAAQLVALELASDDGSASLGRESSVLVQRGWELVARSQLPLPRPVTEPEALDAFSPLWHWDTRSLNVHPLDGWSRRRLPRRDDRSAVRATFEADYLPSELFLVYEHGAILSLVLNGASLTLDQGRSPTADEIQFADPCLRLLAVEAILGENSLEAVVEQPPGEKIDFLEPRSDSLGPFFLAGRFAILPGLSTTSGSVRPILVRPIGDAPLGDWRTFGYPRYSGTATYRQPVVVPAGPRPGGLRLVIEAFDGEATVEVNGEALGVPVRTPCVFDVDSVLRAGVNRVAIAVTGPLGTRISGELPAGLANVRLERWP
jgi:hypothetical protein